MDKLKRLIANSRDVVAEARNHTDQIPASITRILGISASWDDLFLEDQISRKDYATGLKVLANAIAALNLLCNGR